MKYDIRAPRKRKDEPHKDSRDYCAKLTMTATNDLDELILAAIADGIAYKKDKKFLAWLKARIEKDMKRLKLVATTTAAVILLLLCSPAGALAQDITWERGGVKLGEFAETTDATTPLERGAAVRFAIDLIRPSVLPGDTIKVRKEADFGKDVPILLPACNYVGEGSLWRHSILIDETKFKPYGTPGILVSLGRTTFTAMSFAAVSNDPNEDCGIMGCNVPGDIDVSFVDCHADASKSCDWGMFYTWAPGKRVISWTGGKAKGSRFFLFAGDSGGGISQLISVSDVDPVMDANGTRSFGESSSANPDSGGVLAVVGCKGGKVNFKNVNPVSTGLAAQYDKNNPIKYGCPRVAGLVTDSYGGASQPVDVVVDCSTSKITPKLSTVFNDIDIRGKGAVKVIRQEGSASDGSLKLWVPATGGVTPEERDALGLR